MHDQPQPPILSYANDGAMRWHLALIWIAIIIVAATMLMTARPMLKQMSENHALKRRERAALASAAPPGMLVYRDSTGDNERGTPQVQVTSKQISTIAWEEGEGMYLGPSSHVACVKLQSPAGHERIAIAEVGKEFGFGCFRTFNRFYGMRLTSIRPTTSANARDVKGGSIRLTERKFKGPLSVYAAKIDPNDPSRATMRCDFGDDSSEIAFKLVDDPTRGTPTLDITTERQTTMWPN